jgi:predicted nucleic-acid-binding Zn-ribbon protein
MSVFRKCPKCGGQLFVNYEELECIQCGYVEYPDNDYNPRLGAKDLDLISAGISRPDNRTKKNRWNKGAGNEMSKV